jgi:hypothetical protein
MAARPDLRVGDAERDATATRLRESYAQGRLTLDEFNERLSAALSATTERDLSQLTQDLPHSASPASAPAASPPLTRSAPAGGWQGSGYQRRRRRRPGFVPVMLAMALAWLLIFSWLPLRLFPLPGKLAILLVVFATIRGLLRRVWRHGRRF